jgi:hypothetical protein
MAGTPIARNAPCPCGSGRRFKHCHGEERWPADIDVAAIDFVVAGAQRSGTTSLDLEFRRHPSVAMPAARKELHFFDDDARFRDAVVDYAPYHASFPPRRPGELRGEATPSYMYWNPAAERIARYNPAMKVIVVLRNPIARAFSHWNKERQNGREPLPFLAALVAEADRSKASRTGQDRRTSYADRGRYAGQLRRLAAHFPSSQLLVLRSEALTDEPASTLARIAGFLDVPPFPNAEPIRANARRYERPMRREEWEWLAERLAPEIRELEALLGWDCSDWLAPPAFDGPNPENERVSAAR